jgi:glycine/D-amino acid oxidase-like deaminating enzyme/nitrite reductase/ring-hydroxylating ferredoxin subunit
LWADEVRFPAPEALIDDLRADVCVVGAGIAGLSVAYQLTRAGASVVVVERRTIGSGETARTSAHLSNVLDARYADLESLHGGAHTELVAASHARAIDEIEATAAREDIACDLRRVDGYLFATPQDDPNRLHAEYDAARRAGIAVTWVERAPLPAFDTRRCLRFPGQAQFHPLRYLAGLAAAVRRHGGRIVTGHVGDIQESPLTVDVVGGASVTAGAVVVATNTPVNDRITMHTKQAPYRTYVVTLPVPAGSVPPGLYWDTDEPYHYVRLQPHDDARDLLIVGGEDHHTGQGDPTRAPFERLEGWANGRFERVGPVMHRWSGQIIASIDGIGFIGRNPGDAGNVFIATGDTGNGLTHGTVAGMLLADLIAGRTNPWTEVYEPARITPRAAWSFAREGLHVAAGYARWLKPARPQAYAALAPGQGAVLQRGLRKIAVYRDDQGGLHELSAVCPHLGGIVGWNDTEKSWDCPCHGSRFDTNGCVLNGPAASGLEPA